MEDLVTGSNKEDLLLNFFYWELVKPFRADSRPYQPPSLLEVQVDAQNQVLRNLV